MMSGRRKYQTRDKGAVLLTTLLVMSLMSALAVAMMDDIRMAIKRAGNIQAHAQADWYVRAAEDFAVSYLQENFVELDPADQNRALKNPIVSSLPLEGGLMTLTIMDGSQCFPLSSLQSIESDSDNSESSSDDDGAGDDAGMLPADEILKNLFVTIGLSDHDASGLTAAIIDWQDKDQQISPSGAEDYTYLGSTPPYRTSNAPFLTVSELRAVRGMDEELLLAVSPFICAGDSDRTAAAININTLGPRHLPLLTAMTTGNDDSLAAEILASRPGDGYKENLIAELTELGIDPAKAPKEVLYAPSHVWLEADIDFGLARRTVLLEFRIDSGQATRTYRHYGTEGRQPTVPKTEEKEDDTQ